MTELDPKGKLAARRAYQAEVSKRDMWHADGGSDDTPMDCAIRAYLSAAPSPSPAPGVVEAAYLLLSEIDAGNDAEHINGATGPLRTALASLSQPSKCEREGPAARFARWLEDGPKLAKEAGCYVGIKVSDAPAARGEGARP